MSSEVSSEGLFGRLINWLQQLVAITPAVENIVLPDRIGKFYCFFLIQAWRPLLWLLAIGTAVATADAIIPVAISHFVQLLGENSTSFPTSTVAVIVLFMLAHPLLTSAQRLIVNHSISANIATLVRWQSHSYIARQPISFFNSDLTGKLANRVLQTGPALRDTIVTVVTSVWYIVIFIATTIFFLAQADVRLIVPTLIWVISYLLLLRVFLPRMNRHSRDMSSMRSLVSGRLVDSYSNIQTVKLYSHDGSENSYIKHGLVTHNEANQKLLAQNSFFGTALSFINGTLISSTLALSLWLSKNHAVEPSQFAMILPLVWHIANTSTAITQQMSSIFENFGVVQEGMRSITAPFPPEDGSCSEELRVHEPTVVFQNVTFRYPRSSAAVVSLNFSINSHERVAIVGSSGAGKSTIIGLLLRLYEADQGTVSICGQDIRSVSVRSLRASIAVVSQETSILNRSVFDNISFGMPHTSASEVVEAATMAGAHEFIRQLRDKDGRVGYAAHAGERGVKFSGGQRQRIAIARALLKNSPIIVLDEATSALDSESEFELKKRLEPLLRHKTVIAIAHRLGTIKDFDRIIVLEGGRIVEMGSHEQLLRSEGRYALLWNRQIEGISN
ncbi:ABC transporter nucleotide binding/ATPase protein (plasmid) [Allorhizobium ampelinum S4]|uniref:ABC transporter nucleotide binding/ATPase protein n=1 Tax=Allorhizobium ampelinum (strain ATCC BAA-846 / DSM 112012 / S4) TaxID=311402 RepID=B9K382_ALLAM|nr:ABC transporter ATP-binding protein [Allorhizobium ampelinum]ACM39330.1 ABC transporter nucleotide binding/ATPase protein [Allorhizobium ampelinum S4]